MCVPPDFGDLVNLGYEGRLFNRVPEVDELECDNRVDASIEVGLMTTSELRAYYMDLDRCMVKRIKKRVVLKKMSDDLQKDVDKAMRRTRARAVSKATTSPKKTLLLMDLELAQSIYYFIVQASSTKN